MFSKLLRSLTISVLRLAYVMLLGIEYVGRSPKWIYRGAERTFACLVRDIEKGLRSIDEDFVVTMFFATVCMGLFLYVCWIGLYTLFAS